MWALWGWGRSRRVAWARRFYMFVCFGVGAGVVVGVGGGGADGYVAQAFVFVCEVCGRGAERRDLRFAFGGHGRCVCESVCERVLVWPLESWLRSWRVTRARRFNLFVGLGVGLGVAVGVDVSGSSAFVALVFVAVCEVRCWNRLWCCSRCSRLWCALVLVWFEDAGAGLSFGAGVVGRPCLC